MDFSERDGPSDQTGFPQDSSADNNQAGSGRDVSDPAGRGQRIFQDRGRTTAFTSYDQAGFGNHGFVNFMNFCQTNLGGHAGANVGNDMETNLANHNTVGLAQSQYQNQNQHQGQGQSQAQSQPQPQPHPQPQPQPQPQREDVVQQPASDKATSPNAPGEPDPELEALEQQMFDTVRADPAAAERLLNERRVDAGFESLPCGWSAEANLSLRVAMHMCLSEDAEASLNVVLDADTALPAGQTQGVNSNTVCYSLRLHFLLYI